MGTHRTAWHFFFASLLRQRAPRWIEVRDEVPLSDEPLRVDYLLLRRVPEVPPEDPGQTLKGLWRLLPAATIAELKTIGRPYRARNLDRLLGYLHVYFSAGESARAVERASDLAGLLIVPARTRTLLGEVAMRGLVWCDLGGGYAELTGGLFRLFVAEIDIVAEREADDVVALFGNRREHTLEARQFWTELSGFKEATMSVQELEDYDVVVERFLKGLPPERLLLMMPDEFLRRLNNEFIENLPEPAKSRLKKRLGR